MSPEEHDIIARFVQRVAGAPTPGSVPATAAAPLPPLDPEADQHLANLFQQYPEARYRMTQFAFGQEQALANAAQRIQAMEQQLAAVRQGGQAPQAQGGGFFSRLFAGPPGQSNQQAPYAQPYQQQGAPGYAQQQPGFGGPPGYGQQPQYGQPQYGQQQAMRGGSGFLGSALTTAAGVAGGMLAFNAIEGLFTNRGEGLGGGAGAGAEQTGWGATPDQAAPDQSGWQTLPDQSAGADQTGWQNTPDTSAPDDNGGGWDDSGGGGDSDWT